MSLLSSLRKNKQETAVQGSMFHSRAEEESKVVRRRSKRQGSKDNEPADPILPEKKRARRRLIGAVALVLAAVIGLPMIFDSEPKPLADDIVIQIPSKDKTPQTAADRPAASVASASVAKVAASAALDPQEEVIDAPVAAEADKVQATEPAKTIATAVPPSPPRQEHVNPPIETSRPKTEVKSEAKPESKAEPKAEHKAEAKPVVKTADTTKTEDAARAKALLEGKPDPKAADKKAGHFVIQVAALSTKEKIDELQSKLKDAGVKSYTQKITTESGERTRIRIGPFTSKDEAEKVRAKIIKLGLPGTVVPF